MKILFDSRGSQAQVQKQTLARLNTLLGAISSAGYSAGRPWTASFSDPMRPLTAQLEGVDVLVVLTHQRAVYPGLPPAIPADVSFEFPKKVLHGIREWVAEGHGLLLVSNHGGFNGQPPYWPVNDIQLAREFGITIVPAAFANPGSQRADPLVMVPAEGAPREIVHDVSTLVSHNSCGIERDGVTVVAGIPATAKDTSGNRYDPADYAFCVTKPWGKGAVIVAGNSGTAGDWGNRYPAPGMITNGNNLRWYLNCLAYLGLGPTGMAEADAEADTEAEEAAVPA